MQPVHTTDPVVFIHGFLEWGLKTPLYGLCPSFWPVATLQRLNRNHIVLDVGKASSDYDRATEAFYQLMGGQVDYGEAHANQHGHARYGDVYSAEDALHPRWSEEHPIHLVGHSFGATTCIELYQMICLDAFGVGSNHKWVRSITSISGPLTGSTFCNMLGARLDSGVPFLSGGHLMVGAFSVLWKLQNTVMPWLKGVYDLNMPQWEPTVMPWRSVVSTENPMHTSRDLVLYDLLPAKRVERNSHLVYMDKIYLLSIVATPKDPLVVPVGEWSLAGIALWLLYRRQSLVKRRHGYLVTLAVLWWVVRRFRQLDLSKLRLSFWGLTWLIGRHTKAMTSHDGYHGFQTTQWELNDGVVNTYSQIRPRLVEQVPDSMHRVDSCVSHVSIDLKSDGDDGATVERGQWHAYRVDKNHLSGTNWDSEADSLYSNLFKLLNNLSRDVPPSF